VRWLIFLNFYYFWWLEKTTKNLKNNILLFSTARKKPAENNKIIKNIFFNFQRGFLAVKNKKTLFL
jgi:hypothetical protein